jgi:hypothetical protein
MAREKGEPMLPEAGRNGNEGCCGSMPSEPVPSELKCSASAIWSTLRPWRCDICLKFSSTSPISSLEALVEESNQKKRKGRKSQFLFTAQLLRKTNLAETFSKSRSGTIAHKNKKRITAVTHWQENYSLPVLQPMCSEC